MVIDDEKDIAAVIGRSLRSSGFKVCEFTDPVLALEHFMSDPKDHDVVISDINMPRMTGFELVRKIKEIQPETRIILMSSFEINNCEFDKVLPSTHVDRFIQKPIRMARLVEMI
ncbi:MAG TPA: response regulator [Nitrososphaera sp.]|nr:response regulator [Nitrososphaera sp.]